ncbi:hypothetical protein D9Q98_002582 [Chlorella vulgaris]|uniref:beta-galactosidase n=1 Tax=Chlorella vulgaris TaxID=3077 RepID=A0A9D4TTH6_CHLVU|nr:hypothetical protein D9Q98_002582 [Chlorella vulgaris]
MESTTASSAAACITFEYIRLNGRTGWNVLPQWASTRLRFIPIEPSEPYPGHFDWEAVADIERWIALTKEVGLKVLLRPGPYICAEWENGGFPSWFATSKVSGGRTMRMRTHDPLYLEHVDRWSSGHAQDIRSRTSLASVMMIRPTCVTWPPLCACFSHAAPCSSPLARPVSLHAACCMLAGEEVYTVVDFGPDRPECEGGA